MVFKFVALFIWTYSSESLDPFTLSSRLLDPLPNLPLPVNRPKCRGPQSAYQIVQVSYVADSTWLRHCLPTAWQWTLHASSFPSEISRRWVISGCSSLIILRIDTCLSVTRLLTGTNESRNFNDLDRPSFSIW